MRATIVSLLTAVATCLAIAVSYLTLGGPLLATQGWVDWRLHPMMCELIAVRRHTNSIDLFSWQDHNKGPNLPREVQEQINSLQTKIVDLDHKWQTEKC